MTKASVMRDRSADQCGGQPVGNMGLVGIAREVGERQHHNGQRPRFSRRVAGHLGGYHVIANEAIGIPVPNQAAEHRAHGGDGSDRATQAHDAAPQPGHPGLDGTCRRQRRRK